MCGQSFIIETLAGIEITKSESIRDNDVRKSQENNE